VVTTKPLPDPPELPEAARPAWPPWYAPVALLGSFAAIVVASFPLMPVIIALGISDTLAGLALLVLLLVQDGLLVGAALLFASFKRRPRPWHFGVRASRLWPTVGWALLGLGLMIGFEVGYIELLGVDESNVEDLGDGSTVAAVAVALAVIVVAPVAEEFFFRAFFYRALRTRLRVWSAALIDGVVFGALHFQGGDSAVILPVIAVFGVGQCLVYERTGSLFAVIAIHAAFNTFATLSIAPLPAVVIGALVVMGCVGAPRLAGRWPSPHCGVTSDEAPLVGA
jgi:membrane protease YdiL (CAAX protease family)